MWEAYIGESSDESSPKEHRYNNSMTATKSQNMKNKSSLFIVNGIIDYEGSQVLGVYSTLEAAEGALEVYKGKVAADTKGRTYNHSAFDDYSISEHILNADAAS